MIFYTYIWLRENGTPYYVGKGSSDRGFVSDGHRVKCPADISRILVQEFPCETDAFAAEAFLIGYYGREDIGTGCLRNLTDGGGGVVGYRPTEEVRKKWSAVHKGRLLTEEHKRKLSIAAQNRSPEHLAKIAAALRGKPGTRRGAKASVETRRKMSASMTGLKRASFKLSPERLKRLTEQMRGNAYTLGRRLTPEHRQKISDGLLRRKQSPNA